MHCVFQRPALQQLHTHAACPPSTSYAVARPVARRQLCMLTKASKSTVSSSLLSVLKDELKFARESYRREEELLEDPPNDFELDNPPGKKMFYLLKEYNNKREQIIIEVDLDAQPSAKDESDEDEVDSDDEEDEEEEVPPVAFKVQINKEGGCLTFDCESNGEYVVIMDLSLETDPPNDDEEDDEDVEADEPYAGPVFEELDDTLQQAFLDYLEERGVTAELGEYIRLMAADKSQQEYQVWLQQVQGFISQ